MRNIFCYNTVVIRGNIGYYDETGDFRAYQALSEHSGGNQKGFAQGDVLRRQAEKRDRLDG